MGNKRMHMFLLSPDWKLLHWHFWMEGLVLACFCIDFTWKCKNLLRVLVISFLTFILKDFEGKQGWRQWYYNTKSKTSSYLKLGSAQLDVLSPAFFSCFSPVSSTLWWSLHSNHGMKCSLSSISRSSARKIAGLRRTTNRRPIRLSSNRYTPPRKLPQPQHICVNRLGRRGGRKLPKSPQNIANSLATPILKILFFWCVFVSEIC